MKKSIEQIREKMADKFTRDVNGVSQSILSPKGCYQAGFDAGHNLGDEALMIAVEALEFYGNTINWKEERMCWSDAEPCLKQQVSAIHQGDFPKSIPSFVFGRNARQAISKIQELMGDEK